jgi:pilus assembly protein CpaB
MRGGRIFIIVGVVVGLGTMLAALFILSSAPGQQIAPTPAAPTTEKVVVAVQNIGEGTKALPQTVELREVAVSEVPVDALRNINRALGRIARQEIYQGQVVEATMLVTEMEILEEGLNAAILIPKGKVAISLPIDKFSSVAYAIQEGDSVDLLMTLPFIDVDEQSQTKLPLILSGDECPGCVPVNPQISRVTTQLLVQDATILRVGVWKVASVSAEGTAAETEGGEPPPGTVAPPDIVVLLINHQDALVIKYARESGANLDLILRSSGDHDIVTTEPVTLDYMLARFGIVVPPKRPYTLFTFTPEGIQQSRSRAGAEQPQ